MRYASLGQVKSFQIFPGEQDWSDLVVQAPPLYIQEKVHPKVLIDELLRTTKERVHESGEITPDLFSDFNGMARMIRTAR
ncbi:MULTISPECIES: hypothetical protein [unclassified Bradyrhizobium]|uniref:hypothetical protein n=1 Tax=unclassified Bradyrhizobium TaxID=2631580 RepID=UPI001CD34370|nr:MULTISPECIES: hypothetical protein [unclassified Bradyrhizobium]MCA1374326.1 hypothetical protein [Bradyrhizobium sp. IC4060]MCA1484702.1 hypothetical protein [Bradyrhizobium sp. IC4061]